MLNVLLKMKLALQGENFSDLSDIYRGVTELLKGVSLQDIQRTFGDLHKRSQRCVELEWGGIMLEVCTKNF